MFEIVADFQVFFVFVLVVTLAVFVLVLVNNLNATKLTVCVCVHRLSYHTHLPLFMPPTKN